MPFLKLISISLRFIKKQKRLDISGIEPEAFRMQIERDTTTPYTRIKYYVIPLHHTPELNIIINLMDLFNKKMIL